MTAKEVKFYQNPPNSRQPSYQRSASNASTDLGSDQLQPGKLPPSLILDNLGDLGISLGEGGVEVLVKVRRDGDGRSGRHPVLFCESGEGSGFERGLTEDAGSGGGLDGRDQGSEHGGHLAAVLTRWRGRGVRSGFEV